MRMDLFLMVAHSETLRLMLRTRLHRTKTCSKPLAATVAFKIHQRSKNISRKGTLESWVPNRDELKYDSVFVGKRNRARMPLPFAIVYCVFFARADSTFKGTYAALNDVNLREAIN